MKPETPNASHATPHFWREMRMKTLQARQVDLSRLRRSRSAASRPKKGSLRSPRSRLLASLEGILQCLNTALRPSKKEITVDNEWNVTWNSLDERIVSR